jgi:isopenicillin-N epimerase
LLGFCKVLLEKEMRDTVSCMFPDPLPDSERSLWSLPDDWVFLNPGSFGLRLQEVQAARLELLAEFECQPVAFLERHASDLLSEAIQVASSFLGADPGGFGFVTNATEAIDAVLAGLGSRAAEGVLIGEQAYGAVAAAANYAAAEAGVRVVPLSLPVADPSDIVAAWERALWPGTPLAIVDHVTSGTALVQPVAQIVAICRDRGIPVLIDGAHAPGMLDLQIDEIGADWYAGNLHKWIGAPSGAGFLWTAEQHRAATRPLVASHDVLGSYEEAFMWQGTRDVTPWLSVPAAIAAVEHRWGWPTLRVWQQKMASAAGQQMAAAFGTETSDGSGGDMTGALVSVRLPEMACEQYGDRFAFRDEIALRHRVEIAIDDSSGCWWARMSFGAWNRKEDVDRAIDAVRECIDSPRK